MKEKVKNLFSGWVEDKRFVPEDDGRYTFYRDRLGLHGHYVDADQKKNIVYTDSAVCAIGSVCIFILILRFEGVINISILLMSVFIIPYILAMVQLSRVNRAMLKRCEINPRPPKFPVSYLICNLFILIFVVFLFNEYAPVLIVGFVEHGWKMAGMRYFPMIFILTLFPMQIIFSSYQMYRLYKAHKSLP